jgi:hypothetical protein
LDSGSSNRKALVLRTMARPRHALALSAGKGLGFAFQQRLNAQNFGGLGHPLVDFGLGILSQLKPKAIFL